MESPSAPLSPAGEDGHAPESSPPTAAVARADGPGAHRTSLSGWGNFEPEECRLLRPSSWRAARVAARSASPSIPRGLGRAYGDSALQAKGTIELTALDRFIAFDPGTGELECEAGVSLAQIIEAFLPRGWFVATTPGTKFVTVGGAIAADVHGKNHHADGGFGDYVIHLDLLLASGEVVRCSPSERTDLFWATVGGMGLTGVILSARIRLLPVETGYFDVDYRRTASLDETLDLIATTDATSRYSVAWVDCTARGRSLGRAVLMTANDAKRADLPLELRDHPLTVPERRRLSVPLDLPTWTLNPLSVRAFNELYYARNASARKLVDWNAYFYPLDFVLHWNRIYGRRGFVQYQALFPKDRSRAGLVALLERITQERRASFLAVLKSSGKRGRGWLSYLDEGHTLALDFPNWGSGLRPFLEDLDRILLAHGGRLYLAKDAVMSAATFRAMYPEAPRFLALKGEVDPEDRFQSRQAVRVGLVNRR